MAVAVAKSASCRAAPVQFPYARHEERDDSYDLLTQYLHEIAQVPRLTPERERELGKRVQAQLDDGRSVELRVLQVDPSGFALIALRLPA